jgi:DNA-binding XRE family transcriptional regulator
VGRGGDETGEGGGVTYRFRDCERCGASLNLHPVRHIEHGELSACVDVEVADLVLACWQAGIATTESCQDYQELPPGAWLAPDDRHLVFLSLPMADAERFANVLLHTGDEALYGRMFGLDAGDAWDEPTLIPGEELYRPRVQIRVAFEVSYVFPQAEVPLLISRLRAWTTSQHGEGSAGKPRMLVGPTAASSVHVQEARGEGRLAQHRWLAARPQHQADGLAAWWQEGYPWVPGDNAPLTVQEARLLLGESTWVTVCADLHAIQAPLVVTQVEVVDVLEHSTGPDDVPWVRVAADGMVFGIHLSDLAWLRLGVWGLTDAPPEQSEAETQFQPLFGVHTAPSRRAREYFETLVGLAQARRFSEPLAIAMSLALRRLLTELTELDGDLDEVWWGDTSETTDGDVLITTTKHTIAGVSEVWQLRAALPSDHSARRWVQTMLVDLVDRILDDCDLGAWWAERSRGRVQRLARLTTISGLIDARRRQLQLTRQQLAAAADVHNNSVVHWELGDTQPAQRTIPRLARGLRLPTTLVVDARNGVRHPETWPLPNDVDQRKRLA